MNKPLLLCHGHIEIALKLAEEANAEVYLDDIISEAKGYNHRAKVTHYDFTGKRIMKEV